MLPSIIFIPFEYPLEIAWEHDMGGALKDILKPKRVSFEFKK
jgi:hypothetical protein